jgi:hypothetical protein
LVGFVGYMMAGENLTPLVTGSFSVFCFVSQQVIGNIITILLFGISYHLSYIVIRRQKIMGKGLMWGRMIISPAQREEKDMSSERHT